MATKLSPQTASGANFAGYAILATGYATDHGLLAGIAPSFQPLIVGVFVGAAYLLGSFLKDRKLSVADVETAVEDAVEIAAPAVAPFLPAAAAKQVATTAAAEPAAPVVAAPVVPVISA